MTSSRRQVDLPSLKRGEIRDPALTAALRKLELTVRRKLDGVLHGDHLGLLPGPGSEPGESRLYQPGDDVRRMDWSVTARTTHPHVRQMIADRELETWLVVDMSASLDFGTTGCEKRDLAVAAAAAITFLNSGGGNRIGAIIANGDSVRRVPALSGRMHEQEMLRTIATMPKAPTGVRGDLAAAIDALRRPERRRGMAVIISDFLGPINWMRQLRAIAGRHEVLGIEVIDPKKKEFSSWPAAASANPSNLPCAAINFDSPHESAPCGTSQRTTNAHSPHAEGGNVVHRQVARRTHQQIERLRRDCGDDGRDVFATANTRRVQTVGARRSVGPEPCNRFVKVGPTHEETFGASHQQRVTARSVDRCPRRPHSFNCNAKIK